MCVLIVSMWCVRVPTMYGGVVCYERISIFCGM